MEGNKGEQIASLRLIKIELDLFYDQISDNRSHTLSVMIIFQ